MTQLRGATLTVPDVEATAALYARWLDYGVVERGRVAASMAQSWGAPGSAGRPYVVCRAASGEEAHLRFVEGEAVAGYRALRTFGWAVAELCVQDVWAVRERLKDSPFTIIGEPEPLDGLPMILAMQVRGPDGEVLFLTQILGELPGVDLPVAKSLVDRPFILVLGCSDLAATGRWLTDALRLEASPPISLVYAVLSDAFGLERDHKHTIATVGHGRDVFVEIDQYPPAALARESRPGELAPGVALATIAHPDLEALAGGWISPPARQDGTVYAGARSGVLRGPDGVLVEVIEAG